MVLVFVLGAGGVLTALVAARDGIQDARCSWSSPSVCPVSGATSWGPLVPDLVHEVYDHVKFDVYGPTVDAPERDRIGEVLNAALPPV